MTNEPTEFDPDQLGRREFYRLLTALVVPRPIAWVSTTSAEGVDNLAPHSFFTVSCVDPPIVQFTTVGRKDSLRNVEETREFVVSLASEQHAELINRSAIDFPPESDEFEALDIAREPSLRVRPPRVAESPAALECLVHSTTRFGDSTVVFGRVVHAVVGSAYLADGHPEIGRLRPLSRLGGNEWATIGEVHDIPRIRYKEWRG